MKTFFRKSLFLAAAALIILVLVPVMCSSAEPELRIADGGGDWGYPNPFQHYPRGPGYIRMSWVFDTLIWKDQSGFVPALADSWDYDKASKTFTFRLNPRAKWHDERPVTADDVVFTLGYFRKHPYSFIKLADISEARAKDAHTVLIRLSKPYAPFLTVLAATMPILPRHIWESVADPRKYSDPNAFIGSGPYLFRDFNKTKGTYLYEAFAHYYQGRPKVDRLIYLRTGNPLISLINKETDLASIRPEMAGQLAKKGMTVIKDEHGWLKKLMINHKKEPLNDRRFRQALAYAISQREIVEKGHRGFATPASYGLLSIDHEMYNPAVPTYPYDPKKASGLIESLGFTKGADGFFQKNGKKLTLNLLCSTITAGGQSVADRDGEIVKSQLEKIGIAVDLVTMEQTTTDSRIKGWNFDLAISGHGGITGDPVILNEMILSTYGGGSVNSSRYDENPDLNRLLEKSVVEMDQNKRKGLVYEIQKIFALDLPAVPLYYPHGFSAYNPQKGVHWFYTKGGIAKGIPISQNKMALLR